MRSRTAVFAAMLAMAPLGAQAADLVVWWEEGQAAEEDEAVREIIAAFEQKTGKQVELVLGEQEELVSDLVAALEAGRPPPDFVFTFSASNTMSNGRTRVGWSISRTSSATFPTCSTRMRSSASLC